MLKLTKKMLNFMYFFFKLVKKLLNTILGYLQINALVKLTRLSFFNVLNKIFQKFKSMKTKNVFVSIKPQSKEIF